MAFHAADIAVHNRIGFSTENDNGNSGTAKTIDWNDGNKQKLTLTGNCTLTFTAPTISGVTSPVFGLQLRVIQDATGSRTITWPSTVKWPQAQAPTLSTAANAIDIIYLYFDGTNYLASYALGFA